MSFRLSPSVTYSIFNKPSPRISPLYSNRNRIIPRIIIYNEIKNLKWTCQTKKLCLNYHPTLISSCHFEVQLPILNVHGHTSPCTSTWIEDKSWLRVLISFFIESDFHGDGQTFLCQLWVCKEMSWNVIKGNLSQNLMLDRVGETGGPGGCWGHGFPLFSEKIWMRH